MKLYDELKRVAGALENYPGQWAVCGGVAASIYRNQPRFTDDIDIALINSDKIAADVLATRIIEALNYKLYKGFVPGSRDGSQVLGLLQARDSRSERFVGIDFLLPVQFWVEEAVKLAQANKIDYGFSEMPTITPESLIIAKLAAFEGSPGRLQDLDDIQEVIASVPLDHDYLKRQIQEKNLRVPEQLRGKIIS